MNVITDDLIFVLEVIWARRESVREDSAEYARLTVQIQYLEGKLDRRGVDVAKMLWNLAEKQG